MSLISILLSIVLLSRRAWRRFARNVIAMLTISAVFLSPCTAADLLYGSTNPFLRVSGDPVIGDFACWSAVPYRPLGSFSPLDSDTQSPAIWQGSVGPTSINIAITYWLRSGGTEPGSGRIRLSFDARETVGGDLWAEGRGTLQVELRFEGRLIEVTSVKGFATNSTIDLRGLIKVAIAPGSHTQIVCSIPTLLLPELADQKRINCGIALENTSDRTFNTTHQRGGFSTDSPLTYEACEIVDNIAVRYPDFVEVGEVLHQWRPGLRVRAVRISSGQAPPPLHCEVPSFGRSIDIAWLRFGQSDLYIADCTLGEIPPLAKSTQVLLRTGRQELMVENLPLRINESVARIEAVLPEAEIDRLSGDPYALVRLFKQCAIESAGYYEMFQNEKRPRQIQLLYGNGEGLEPMIDAFLAEGQKWLRETRSPYELRYPILAWQSQIDGTWLPLRITYPFNIQPGKKYPLNFYTPGFHSLRAIPFFIKDDVIQSVTGAMGVSEGDSFRIYLFGRGHTPAPFGVEELDHVISWAKQTLPVDDRLISITGSSQTSGHATLLAEWNPDRFCFVEIRGATFGKRNADDDSRSALSLTKSGWPNVYPLLGNLGYIPLRFQVGGSDKLAKESADAIAEEGCGLNLNLLPGFAPKAGHSFRMPDVVAEPRAFTPELPVRFRFLWARKNMAYGLAGYARDRGIAGFDLMGMGSDTIQIEPHNLRVLRIEPSEIECLAGRRPTRVILNGRAMSLTNTPDPSYFALGTSGWEPCPATAVTSGKVPGRSGPIQDVLLSRMMIVVGTQDPKSTAILQARARKVIAAIEGYGFGRMGAFTPRLVTDREVNRADLTSANLVLIGSPNENSVSNEISRALPIQIVNSQRIQFRGETVNGQNLHIDLVYKHPFSGEHTVLLDWGLSTAAYEAPVMAAKDQDFCITATEEGRAHPLVVGSFDGSWN